MAKMKPGLVRNAKVTAGPGGPDISDIVVVTIRPDGRVNIKVVRPDGRITPGTDVVITLPDKTTINGRLSGSEFTSPPGAVAVE